MDAQQDLIGQLEGLLADKDISRRADILHRVTDLFILGSGKFSEYQVELFDNVMGMLVKNIELAARVQFGSRIARLPDAPVRIVRELAFDDAVAVAGPVLLHSDRLDEQTLVQNARTMSQDHLLAISGRKVLAEAVTDVLVERGNQSVVASTARNDGARFSTFGISTLVEKSCDDGDLAMCVWSRPDIPRQSLIKLFMEVSEAVRSKLASADPRKAESIRAAVAKASDQIQTQARAGSSEFAQARSHVVSLHSSGRLDEARLLAFANGGSFENTTIALSLMCELPVGLVERALVQKRTEQILVLAKAIDLSWDTTRALLLLQAVVNDGSQQQLDQCAASFSRLQPKTARTALQFYRMREKAAG